MCLSSTPREQDSSRNLMTNVSCVVLIIQKPSHTNFGIVGLPTRHGIFSIKVVNVMKAKPRPKRP
jgi:hypothetical protein